MRTRDPAKWDPRFMAMAKLVSSWSSDPRKQVGAVVASPDGRRFSLGYNGLPRDFQPLGMMDKQEKNRYSLHAEDNAIDNATTDLTGWTLYVTEAPCLRCALAIHRAGIARVAVGLPIDGMSSWADDQSDAQAFLQRHGVEQVYLREDEA